MGQKIIDAHAHPIFGNELFIKAAKVSEVKFNLKSFRKDLKRLNIIKTVAVPISVDHLKINEIIKKLVLGNVEFIGACTISPLNYKHEELEALEDDIKKGIFRAIKLFPGYEFFYPNQKECEPIYEMAERNKIPVMFHTGDTWIEGSRVKYSHPLHIDDVAVSFPNIKFIICHLGNPWITDASEVLYKNKNVYADLSGFFLGNESNISKEYSKMMNKKIMECFYYCGSVDKIMFGTDYPLASHEFYIKFVNKLELSKKELNKIFFENAVKIFNIKL
jgi:predicted TIM-barrel fold metal-dependent hydrolase